MNYFWKAVMGVALGVTATITHAASMDPLDPIADNGFDTASALLTSEAGDGVQYDAFSDFFTASTASSSDPFVLVNSFALTDPTQADIELTIGMDPTVSIIGAEDVFVSANLVQFLFIDVFSSLGYLVEFATDATDSNGDTIDFTDSAAFIGAEVEVTLTQYSAAVVPLPASLPLVLVGIGGLVAIGRRKKAAA